MNKINKRYFGEDMMPIDQQEKRTLLAFVNINPALDESYPLSPNVIPIGGIQIKQPKSLPNDLDTFINGSTLGAVLFSLGTNIKSEYMTNGKKYQFLEAFRQMPDYRFLWKIESVGDLDVPKNVLIQKWLPQSDILAHPKVKLFITHSGQLSTHEAIWRNVPVLSIPFILDQHKVNMIRNVKGLFYLVRV